MPHRPRAATLPVTVLDGLVITRAGIEAFDCPLCGGPRELVVPDCGDPGPSAGAAAGECPDRACVECGFGLVVGTAAYGAVPTADRRAG